jgi:hypothetical protein
MKTVARSRLSTPAMIAGGELKYTKVIMNGVLKEWVGIGWIELRQATPADIKKYPTVED